MEKAKILLVDDEEALTTSLSKFLRAKGYQVNAVPSGKQAIQALEDDGYDIVVLDLKMPGMDGITTLKEIKKLGLLTEIMILTGHGSIDSAFESFNLGAYDFLTKPFALDDLLMRIEGAIQK